MASGRQARAARAGRRLGALSLTEPSIAAQHAADAAGVRIEELDTLDQFAQLRAVFDNIWRPEPTNPPVTTEWLCALAAAGSYLVGAYDGEQLVGGSVAVFGPPERRALHSHVTGVAAGGRDIGLALKFHQRAWALQRGVTTISWTFDPLIRRNAYFNLVKLAANAVAYLPNFYGQIPDAINAGDESDRLLVRWTLEAPEVVAACAGQVASADPTAEWVPVPPDIESLRTEDPEAAQRWRLDVRAALLPLLAAGGRILGFDRAGWYLVDRPP